VTKRRQYLQMLYVRIKSYSWGKNCAAPCVHRQHFASRQKL